MRKPGNGEISEVLKVRHFVMNILYRSRGCSVMIPTIQALAEQFGIARSTVQLALKDMSEQGYLIGRPGIGTFTNPRSSIVADDRLIPLVGLKINAGDLFYYGYHLMRLTSELGLALTEWNCNLRFLNQSGNKPETVRRELEHAYIDALVAGFVNNPEYLREAAELVPVINVNDVPVPGVHNFLFDYTACRRKFLDYLGGRECCIAEHSGVSERQLYHVLHEVLSRCERVPEVEQGDPRVAFREFLLHRRPRALVVYYQQAAMVTELFDELKIDPFEECCLIADKEPPPKVSFRGAFFRLPMRAAAEQAAERMAAIFAGNSPAPRDVVFETEFVIREK